MCKQFGYTKQAYYKQLTTVENTNVKEEIIVGLIKKKREIWKRGSGRNLYQSLKEDLSEHQLKILPCPITILTSIVTLCKT